jgi:hypothetical protein
MKYFWNFRWLKTANGRRHQTGKNRIGEEYIGPQIALYRP